MRQVIYGNPGRTRGAKVFHPERPMLIKPTVHPIPVEDEGELLYVGMGKDIGKVYKQELFDNMFKRKQ